MLTWEYAIDWTGDTGRLWAMEPNPSQLSSYAEQLAAAYNERHNRNMMGNTTDFSAEDVEALYRESREAQGRSFLLFREQELLGDADFRRIESNRAEFAIMIGPRAVQGQGLGTRFAALLHYWAFRALHLDRTFVTILPQNTGSCRLFEKLGYLPDNSELARSYADDTSDLSFSLTEAQLLERHGQWLRSASFGSQQ